MCPVTPAHSNSCYFFITQSPATCPITNTECVLLTKFLYVLHNYLYNSNLLCITLMSALCQVTPAVCVTPLFVVCPVTPAHRITAKLLICPVISAHPIIHMYPVTQCHCIFLQFLLCAKFYQLTVLPLVCVL